MAMPEIVSDAGNLEESCFCTLVLLPACLVLGRPLHVRGEAAWEGHLVLHWPEGFLRDMQCDECVSRLNKKLNARLLLFICLLVLWDG